MTDTENRIRLAETMRWKRVLVDTPRPGHYEWLAPDGTIHLNPPDPYTDANDDYAVLQWMRHDEETTRESFVLWMDFVAELNRKPHGTYQIGDYARAALKVLDQQDTEK